MAKKPADQTSTNGANGAGDAVDLETQLDGDLGDGGAGDGEDGDEDESGEGGQQGSDQLISQAVERALKAQQQVFQSEMDRRINQALAKMRTTPPKKQEPAGEGDGTEGQVNVVADVRGARIAFREYLPESIKLLSPEERALASEYGQNLIKARAHGGFDDEDQTGREVAEATAAFLKRARTFYSDRTKRVLEKQGALQSQGGGQSPNGGAKPDTIASAQEAALKKDMELFPDRYPKQ